MRSSKFLKAAAFTAVLAIGLTACGGDDDDTTTGDATAEPTGDATAAPTDDDVDTGELNLVADGTLTVCTDAPYPPMEIEDPESPTGFSGFDIELMGAIADNLGLEFAVINSGFDPITTGSAFAAGQCDIAAASITITEEREENIDFTEPYFTADQSLLVKADSGITSLADLAGQTIGVQSGTTGEAYANENAPEGATVQSFDDPGGLFPALEADTIQGVLQDIVVNQGRALEDDTVVVVETFPTDEQYGFAVAEEGSDALLEAVNGALETVQNDGTYDALFDEWFPTA
ncbi:MAG: transporter substrate-binding domain-containing protein [Actinobacteria bacterium]|nr:transporter substrate-binding domain-containing protein [Actinomycetota bacterium]